MTKMIGNNKIIVWKSMGKKFKIKWKQKKNETKYERGVTTATLILIIINNIYYNKYNICTIINGAVVNVTKEFCSQLVKRPFKILPWPFILFFHRTYFVLSALSYISFLSIASTNVSILYISNFYFYSHVLSIMHAIYFFFFFRNYKYNKNY